MKATMLRVLFFLCLSLFAGMTMPMSQTAGLKLSHAEDAWRVEFDDVCGKSQQAMEMTVPELQKLLERCDKLKPQIEALEASPRKVFLKRLQLCHDLFAYVLESKNTTAPK